MTRRRVSIFPRELPVTRLPMKSFKTVFGVSAVALVASLGCMRATANAEGAPLAGTAAGAPKLVVLITVDQLRGDMLDRYRGDMKSGYVRLMRGAWFVNAFQDHAITETAPGHASLLSGRFPRTTGIVSNSAGVVDPNYRLLEGFPNEAAASPGRFRGTTLFDWLYAKNRNTRAFSVSMKDRAAILPIGKAKQDVYWYSGIGAFTTSNYYRDTLPTWVREFNARELPYKYAGTEWKLSRDLGSYAEPDSVPFENRGRDLVFPHRYPDDGLQAASYLRQTPGMDSITALFALEGLKQTNIGHGPHTDVFSVSFSATDIVGHGWGPDSREAHENQIRLDQTIGWFLDSLYRLRDSASIVIALSADHGVQPIPELARSRGEATGNQGLRVNLRTQIEAVRAGLRAAGADTMAFLYDGELVGVDRAALRRDRVNADSLLNTFAVAARAVPGVLRVDRMRDILNADFATDPIARRWAHQVPEGSAVELVITLTKYSYWGASIPATHGSPHDLDAHVPIIFYGPWIQPGRYTTFARTVDIGATLAQIAEARPTQPIDGVVLANAIKR